jgi:hypothetical protein
LITFVVGVLIYFICKKKCFPEHESYDINAPKDGIIKKGAKQIIFGPAAAKKDKHKETADE